MKKYFNGEGYFHEKRWTDDNGNKCSIPNQHDDIVIDNRSIYVAFEFKNIFHKFLYNLKIAYIEKSLFYWNNMTFKSLTINTNGNVLIGLTPLKSSVITYQVGTVTCNK